MCSPGAADRAHYPPERVPAEQAVIQLAMANEVQIAQAVAAHAGLPYVKINPLDLDLDVVTKGLSAPFARKHGLVAISKTETTITVAVFNPFAPFPEEDIKRVTGLGVARVVATRSDIETVNKGFYDLKASLTSAEKQLTEGRLATVDLGNQEYLSGESKELDPAAAPVVKALDHILSYAFEQRASDIHFEPKRELTLVRLRIDGLPNDVHLIRIVYQAASRASAALRPNLAEKRRPHYFESTRAGRADIERGVPCPRLGEKAVARSSTPHPAEGIDDLGASARYGRGSRLSLGGPPGSLLFTGPTARRPRRCSILKHLSNPELTSSPSSTPSRWCFEDFNRWRFPPIAITFASAPAPVLRQDPYSNDRRDPDSIPPTRVRPAHLASVLSPFQQRRPVSSRACSPRGCRTSHPHDAHRRPSPTPGAEICTPCTE